MTLAHHYQTLGLHRDASFQDIKMAYRQLVRQCHPDIHPGEQAVEQFIQINDAYNVLSAAVQKKARKRSLGGKFSLGNLKLQLETFGIGRVDRQSDSVQKQPQKKYQPETYSEKHANNYSEEDIGADNTTKPDAFSTSNSEADVASPSGNANGNCGQEEDNPPKTYPSRTTLNVSGTADDAANAPSHSRESAVYDYRIKHEAYLQLKELLRQKKFPRAITLVEGLAHRIPNDSEIIQWQAIAYQRWGRYLINQREFHKARLYLKKALQTDPHNPSLWSEVKRDCLYLARMAGETTGQSSNTAM